MTSKLTIYATLPAQVEEREGRWCAIQDSLGLVAHGNTADEASTRLITAANLLIDELLKHGGKEALTANLERAGISFTISEKGEDTPKMLPLVLSFAKPLESP
jgi:predicted RNase H-like HicB family nuclease